MILIVVFSVLLLVVAGFILYWRRNYIASFFSAFLFTLPFYFWLGLLLPGCPEFRSIPFGQCTINGTNVFFSLVSWWLTWSLVISITVRYLPKQVTDPE
ncbi:MAG TPA: hypothetical protein VLN56_05585 [Gammaproteobacteria bacterium]|nr:hypothetical protein [Gammaproteobacteria bacterium]